jgi:carbamate kinase
MPDNKGLILIALGGNALSDSNSKGSADDHIKSIEVTAHHLYPVFMSSFDVILTHGNGPQVGNILIQNEATHGLVPSMPLDVCVAESQGEIGYMLQRIFKNVFKKFGIEKNIVTVVSQTLVDSNDQAFEKPTKPIGPYYSKTEAVKLINEKGWIMHEDPSGKGFRRVVPSPKPIRIIESRIIQQLLLMNNIPIAVGGGGIPVLMDNEGNINGVEAVIDKDLASAQLAIDLKADKFLILTNVSNCFLNFKKSSQIKIDEMNLDEAQTYMEQGQFSSGSMGPKVQAAIEYLINGGKEAFITNIENILPALNRNAGTYIHH